LASCRACRIAFGDLASCFGGIGGVDVVERVLHRGRGKHGETLFLRERGRATQDDENGKDCGKTMHRGAPSVFAGRAFARRKSGVNCVKDATGGSAVPSIPTDLQSAGYREPGQYQPDGPGKGDLLVYFSSTGRTAIEIESSLAPLTCSTNDPPTARI